MAIRQEELLVTEAVIYCFPSQAIRARRARSEMLARRRMTLGMAAALLALALLVGTGPGDHLLEGPDRPVMTQKISQ